MASDLVSSALNVAVAQLEVRTAFSPPIIIDVNDALSPTPISPGGLPQLIQPTVIASGGAAGTQVLAPWGQVSPNAWRLNLLVLGGTLLVAGGLFVMGIYKVGVFSGRR